jgi:LysR family cyn operon transcriptional activator
VRDIAEISRHVELRHLRYFLALAGARSFTNAAERLNVTQPTLSHQIKRLETAVGATLFERRTKDVELTQAGRLLLPYCERILKEVELGALALSELEGMMRGTLYMGVSHSFSSTTLPGTLAEFASHYPGVHVIARVVPHLAMEQALIDGELDLAVAYVSENTEQIAAEPLIEEQLALIVGSAHPWAGRPSVPVRALAEIPLILLTSEYAARQYVESRLAAAKLAAKIVLEMNAIEPILATVRNSKLGTVLSDGAMPGSKDVHLIRLYDPVPRRTLAILWRRQGHRSAAAERMAAMIRATYRVSDRRQSVA